MGLAEPKLKFFAEFIKKELGIVYGPEVYFQLEQRLEKVAKYLGLPGADEVHNKAVKEGIVGDFKQFLLDIATNNETSFFRDPKIFNGIEKTLIPELSKNPPAAGTGGVYRVWCCAASFGQEPYSMAILVHEFLKRNPLHPKIEIIATDIADHALERCKKGIYTQLEVQRGMPAPKLISYFTNMGDGHWELKPEIRKLVTFKKQNLLDSFGMLGKFNLVLCRYVLIYQDTEKKKNILKRIKEVMLPGATLILGASESALGLVDGLNLVTVSEGIVGYR